MGQEIYIDDRGTWWRRMSTEEVAKLKGPAPEPQGTLTRKPLTVATDGSVATTKKRFVSAETRKRMSEAAKNRKRAATGRANTPTPRMPHK